MGLVRTFDHLEAMTDRRGLFEHAEGAVPRVEHGYCTDDNARMLVVTSREPDTGAPGRLSRVALAFTLAGLAGDGRTRNRMDPAGRWTDEPGTDDCWGRSVWAFGVAATQHEDASVRAAAAAAFDRAVRQRSRWPRAMAFAALGAADVVASDPDHAAAREVLRDAVAAIGAPAAGGWAWPERRLTYANAALAEAVIAAGGALVDARILRRGLAMLDWLLSLETRRGHLSVTGVGGRREGDHGPQFDQQGIEAAAMADACWRAAVVTGDPAWSGGVATAAAWFLGANDVGIPMCDERTGAGFDGLQPGGANRNQGAESTLAALSAAQRAGAFAPVA
jgi:hypothetical protein